MNSKLILFLYLLVAAIGVQKGYAQCNYSQYDGYANAALESFVDHFWNSQAKNVNWVFPSDGTFTQYWIYAESYNAVIDGAWRTNNDNYKDLISEFYDTQNSQGWFRSYYDDENWMAMALIEAYQLTNTDSYLHTAEILVQNIMTAWDTTCCGSHPGGIWWDTAHTQKATASNAGPVIACSLLYIVTKNTTYLDFAMKVYNYWNSTMINSQYQVADHIDTSGSIVWWQFTYDNGLMVGAAVSLYEATNDASYLTQARNFASFMLSKEITQTTYGAVLYDGTNSGCSGDCMQFKGPAFRYLMWLWNADKSSNGDIYTFLQNNVDSLWNLARDTQYNTFAINWAGPSQTTIYASQQNAAVVATNLFALFCNTTTSPFFPFYRY